MATRCEAPLFAGREALKWAPHTFFRKRAKALASLAAVLNARGVPVF